jgi:DNA-binding GntR family transcriptional regulator
LYTEYIFMTAPMALTHITLEPDLVERVYAALVDSITEGTLAPGARLAQEDLAAQLNVSRQPVLQALRLLKKDGFVIDTGKRGVMVTPINATWIAQVYQLRSALDALAARLAAQRKADINQGLLDRGRKAARGRSVAALVETDMAFHNAIYAASGNPLIAESANRHWAHIRRAMGAVLLSAGVRESVWDEHTAIREAIMNGEVASAERLTCEHGELAGRTLANRIHAQLAAA